MTRSLVVNAIAMIFGLGLALWVWTSGEVKQNPRPVLLDWQPEQITHLEYVWPKGHAVVEYNAKNKDVSFTLSGEVVADPKKPNKAAAASTGKAKEDAGVNADAAAPEDAARGTENRAAKVQLAAHARTKKFPAGSITLRGIEALAPLRANHELGDLSAEQLAKLGLGEVKRRLTIAGPQGRRVLEIGDKSYGGRGVYARWQGQKTVYLIPATVSAAFEGPAGKLMESRIVPIQAGDVSAVDFKLAAQRQRFVQVDGKKKGQRYYALATSPENKSDAATTLISRLYGLRALEYLQQVPLPAAVNEIGSIKLERKEAAPVTLKIMEQVDGQGYIIERGPWFAKVRSERLRPLLDDLSALLSDSAQQ